VANAANISYRFGPFEVNASNGELLKEGRRLKLQEQPFRILVILLETPGEVVSRAELKKRIWPESTFGDFDSGLRVAVGKLRDALGDDADNPRFIETIPKRGYRLLISVSQLGDSDVQTIVLPSPSEEAAGTAPPPKLSKLMHVVVGAALAGIAVVSFLVLSHRRKVLTEQDFVVLADFANSTGDPVFDETLRQGLAVQLGQSPFLSIISEERVEQELSLMGKAAGTRLTSEIAREVCERTASAAVFDGSITTLGHEYVLGLRAKDCRTGQIIAQEQVEAAGKEDVLDALSHIASSFRTRVGESLATVKQHNTPLPEATTSSLEALKAYSTGLKVSPSMGEAAALPLFRRATEIDPKFAMAYAWLGLMYGTIGESELSAENTRKAYELRYRTSDAERFFIVASYDSRVTGNFEKAQQTCETWAQTFPRSIEPHAYLAGFIFPALGRYEDAVKEAQKMIDIDADYALAYSMIVPAYLALERTGDAENALRQASERKMTFPDLSVQRYDIAFIKGDNTAMQRSAAFAQKIVGAEDFITDRQAYALAYTGRLAEARIMAQRAETLAERASHPARAALFGTGHAVWQAVLGDVSAAKRDALAALKHSKDRELLYGVALALVLSGDNLATQKIAADLERRFPEDTSVKFSYLPTLRAFLELNHGEPAKAIEALQIAAPYELGTQRSTIHGGFGALYPVYARGKSYLTLHQGAQAAAEFQKIVDHRGVVISDPIGVLAYLELGRAYAMQGDTEKSRSAYETFLRLWKNADSGLAVLENAKREYGGVGR